jgi:hypothetical protein
MSVPLRRAGLLLALTLLLTASAALADDMTRFDDLLCLVRAEPDPATVLQWCGATVFTLNADQRDQRTAAGATASLIVALQKKRMSLDDVQNFALVVDCSGGMKEKQPGGLSRNAVTRIGTFSLHNARISERCGRFGRPRWPAKPNQTSAR